MGKSKQNLTETESREGELKSATLVAVLAHQGELKSVYQVIENLERLIEVRRSEINAAESSITPQIDNLTREREDLLASIATGQATADELAEFDTKSEAQKEAHRNAVSASRKVTEEARQAINGLERRLGEAQRNLQALNDKTGSLLKQILMSEAESSCAQYVQAAMIVKEQYLKLMVIDDLLKSRKAARNGITNGLRNNIEIPAFALPQCDGLGYPNWPGLLFSSQVSGYSSNDGSEALKSLMQAFHDTGITLI